MIPYEYCPDPIWQNQILFPSKIGYHKWQGYCCKNTPVSTCYTYMYITRDWLPKFATGLNIIIGCSSKNIWLTRLLFCQNGSPTRGSFWQKNSFITQILFELQPIIIFSPVANFGNQSIPSFGGFDFGNRKRKRFVLTRNLNLQLLPWFKSNCI